MVHFESLARFSHATTRSGSAYRVVIQTFTFQHDRSVIFSIIVASLS